MQLPSHPFRSSQADSGTTTCDTEDNRVPKDFEERIAKAKEVLAYLQDAFPFRTWFQKEFEALVLVAGFLRSCSHLETIVEKHGGADFDADSEDVDLRLGGLLTIARQASNITIQSSKEQAKISGTSDLADMLKQLDDSGMNPFKYQMGPLIKSALVNDVFHEVLHKKAVLLTKKIEEASSNCTEITSETHQPDKSWKKDLATDAPLDQVLLAGNQQLGLIDANKLDVGIQKMQKAGGTVRLE